MKKALSFIFVLTLCLGIFFVIGKKPAAAGYENGDLVKIGSYPQTRVTDSALISALNNVSKTWINYPYYSPNTGSDASTYPIKLDTSIMKYADITYQSQKYRAVYIYSERPEQSLYPVSQNQVHPQKANGYNTGTTYYFKWEPLVWEILDADTGMAITAKSIDAQEFNTHFIVRSDSSGGMEYRNGIDTELDANDFYGSTIERWLNGLGIGSSFMDYRTFNFLNSAFTASEQTALFSKEIVDNNSGSFYRSDKVMLLTKDQFNTYKSSLIFSGATDYAEAQGESEGYYLTRSALGGSGRNGTNRIYYIQKNGISSSQANHAPIYSTMNGVRPLVYLDLSSSYIQDTAYTLTFNGKGGTNVPPAQKANENGQVTITTQLPDKFPDYYFAGWSTSSSALTATYAPGQTITLTKDTTLYAVYSSTKTWDLNYSQTVTISQQNTYVRYKVIIPYTGDYTFYCTNGTSEKDPYIKIMDFSGKAAASNDNNPSGGYNFSVSPEGLYVNDPYYLEIGLKPGQTGTINLYSKGVPYKPEIVTQPVTDRTVSAGDNAVFYVQANGKDISYQWYYRNSSSDSWKASSSASAKTASFSFTAQESHSGHQYRCEITNIYGSVTSNISTVHVVPRITAQPSDQSVAVDCAAKFTVAANGTNLKYQWQYRNSSTDTWKNSTMACAKTNTFTFKAAESHSGHQYRCAVSNGKGTAYSNAATLTVRPLITTQPNTSVTVAVGGTVKLTTAAKGTNLKYQWQYRNSSSDTWKNSTMACAKTNTFTFTAAESHSGHQYRCNVSNGKGTTPTKTVTVTVTPKITTQPANASVAVDCAAKFTVAATGTNLKYQWQYRNSSADTWKNSTMACAKTNTFTFTAAESHSGHQYRCAVSNGKGTAYSNAATLTVRPLITTQPKDTTVSKGATVKLTVAAKGTNLKYQWQYRNSSTDTWKNSTMACAKTNTFTFTAAESHSGHQYRCNVSNGKGTTPSKAATVTVK